MRSTTRPDRVPRLTALLAGAALVICLPGCTARPAAPEPSAGAGAGSSASASGTPTSTPPSPTPTPTGPATTVAVLGDSLSRGFNACSSYGDCPSVSWAGGDAAGIDSVATRIGRAVDGPVTVTNVARSGATVADLGRQVALAASARPDVATVLIGANDVCRGSIDAMTSTADYAAAAGAALQQLAASSPDTVILLASVPDVPALLPAAAKDPTARFLWSHAGGCATVLADPLSTSTDSILRRAAVTGRIAEYDAALQALCAALPACVFDGGALNRYRPTLAQLSALDAFHPSLTGLRQLARLEWAVLSSSDRGRALLER